MELHIFPSRTAEQNRAKRSVNIGLTFANQKTTLSEY